MDIARCGAEYRHIAKIKIVWFDRRSGSSSPNTIVETPDHALQKITRLLRQATDPLGTIASSNGESDLAVWADMLLCLAAEGMATFVEMIQVLGEKRLIRAPVSRIAYAARNLLELMIWTKWCCLSKENAVSFRQDCVRDAQGLLIVVKKHAELGFELGLEKDNWQSALDNAGSAMNRMAEMVGIVDLNAKFKPVAEAARELGPETAAAFSSLNILLSKFGHPTAFIVRGVPFQSEANESMLMELVRLATELTVMTLFEIHKSLPRLGVPADAILPFSPTE